jgi:hypothetical protein
METIKKSILENVNLETNFCKNRNWVQEKISEVKEVFKSDFFLVEILFKYGSLNDIYSYSFDNIDKMNEYKRNSNEQSNDDKWLLNQFFSDGFKDSYNDDL